MRRVLKPLLALASAACLAGSPVTAAVTEVRGEVVDLECSLEKGDHGHGDAHAACAMSCAKDGKPMGILAADQVYVIEGDYVANQNAKLLDFVAQKVMAKGDIREHDGTKFIRVVSMTVQPTTGRK